MDVRQPFDLMDLATSYGGSDEVMQLALVALTSYSVFRGDCITIQFHGLVQMERRCLQISLALEAYTI